MAKRDRKVKLSKEEIEAQRQAAHENVEATVEAVEEERAPHPANDAIDIVPEWKRDGNQADFESALEGEAGDDDELEEPDPSEDEEKPEPNSIVKEKFKLKYIENAKMVGATGKAARRSNWDWLAQRIAEECLGEKEKINIESFQDLLDANGVDWSKWTNRNKGWEGRFRMTGRVALQRVVAERGELKTMAGISVPPPDWIAKYKKV